MTETKKPAATKSAKDTFYRVKTTVATQDYTAHEGELVRGTHPVVKAAPDYVEEVGDYIDRIEQATAAPGEKR